MSKYFTFIKEVKSHSNPEVAGINPFFFQDRPEILGQASKEVFIGEPVCEYLLSSFRFSSFLLFYIFKKESKDSKDK